MKIAPVKRMVKNEPVILDQMEPKADFPAKKGHRNVLWAFGENVKDKPYLRVKLVMEKTTIVMVRSMSMSFNLVIALQKEQPA